MKIKPLTARQKKIMVRDETIYRTLRDFQDGKITRARGAYTVVGMLTPELTVVYDKVLEAVNKV